MLFSKKLTLDFSGIYRRYVMLPLWNSHLYFYFLHLHTLEIAWYIPISNFSPTVYTKAFGTFGEYTNVATWIFANLGNKIKKALHLIIQIQQTHGENSNYSTKILLQMVSVMDFWQETTSSCNSRERYQLFCACLVFLFIVDSQVVYVLPSNFNN